MRRDEANGHVTFDPSEEIEQAEVEIEHILATLNPSHPNTLAAIMAIVGWYGNSIDKAWSSEYVDRTLKDAQTLSGTTLAAVLAGIRVGKETDGETPENC